MTPLEEEQTFLADYRRYLDRTGDPVIGSADPSSALAYQLSVGVKMPSREKFTREPLIGRLKYFNSADSEYETVRIGYAFGLVDGISVIPWESTEARLYFDDSSPELALSGTTLTWEDRREFDYSVDQISTVWEYTRNGTVAKYGELTHREVSSSEDSPEALPQLSISDHLLFSLKRRQVIDEFVPFVDTLQSDQYRIVNHDPYANLVVINGPAGSGKTGCALLRIALRHYRYANDTNQESKNLRVMIVSKQSQLLTYVSSVVPSLGYDQPHMRPFSILVQEALENIRARTTQSSASFDLPILQNYSSGLIEGMRAEFHQAMESLHPVLVEQVFSTHVVLGIQIQHGVTKSVVVLNGTSIENDLLRPIDDKPILPLVDTRLWSNALWLAKDIRSKGEGLINSILIDKQFGQLPIIERPKVRNILERWLATVVENAKLHQPRNLSQWIGCIQNSTMPLGSRTLKSIHWAVENCHSINPIPNAVSLVYAVIREFDPSVTIRPAVFINDIVLDEAQNFTLSELNLLRILFPLSHSYTLCGDLNQRLDDACISDWYEVEPLFGSAPDIFYLTRNLRNTQQINAASLTLIGDQISDPSPVSGPPVRIITNSNNDYANIIDELRTSIDNLDNPKIVIIGSKPYVDRLTVPIEIVDIDAIGGLEYDGAVVVIHGLPDSSKSRRSLYVALTRSRWAVTMVIEDDKSLWVKDLLGSAPPDCVSVD